jgi:hypothetical protein
VAPPVFLVLWFFSFFGSSRSLVLLVLPCPTSFALALSLYE